jgi:hypothetical protein
MHTGKKNSIPGFFSGVEVNINSYKVEQNLLLKQTYVNLIK